MGNVYVADSANETIRKVTPGGQVTTLAGTAGLVGTADGTGDRRPGFNGPIGVAVDRFGQCLCLADCDSRTIRRWLRRLVTTLAGMASRRLDRWHGQRREIQLSSSGVAVDAAGSVYVSDYENCTIRKIASAGGDDARRHRGRHRLVRRLGSAARSRGPDGIAVYGSGSVYVADCGNNTIRKITAGGLVSTLAGTAGNTGSANGTGGVAMFTLPTALPWTAPVTS